MFDGIAEREVAERDCFFFLRNRLFFYLFFFFNLFIFNNLI